MCRYNAQPVQGVTCSLYKEPFRTFFSHCNIRLLQDASYRIKKIFFIMIHFIQIHSKVSNIWKADRQTDIDGEMKIDRSRQTDVVWQLETDRCHLTAGRQTDVIWQLGDRQMSSDTWRQTDADWLWLTERCRLTDRWRLISENRRLEIDRCRLIVEDRHTKEGNSWTRRTEQIRRQTRSV